MADEPEVDERYNWGPLVADLAARREAALGMGGPERVERQRSLGKWPVRERLDALLDPGTFTEFGLLADAQVGERLAEISLRPDCPQC